MESTKEVPAAGTRRKPPNAGKGRKAGVPNKLTRTAKEAFQHAFEARGGAEGLAAWAKRSPTEFYKLYARLIPVETRISDPEGKPLSMRIEFVRPSGKSAED